MMFCTVLHDIRSLHNVGSIFRTANGAGFQKIYLCGVTPEPVDRLGHPRNDFQKVALGAEKTVAWEHAKSAVRTIKSLKKAGWKIFAVEQAEGSVEYHKFSISNFSARGGSRAARQFSKDHPQIALVMGNEAEGLPKKVLALADQVLEIPMYGSKESLNVSVAFGIVAYHFATQFSR